MMNQPSLVAMLMAVLLLALCPFATRGDPAGREIERELDSLAGILLEGDFATAAQVVKQLREKPGSGPFEEPLRQTQRMLEDSARVDQFVIAFLKSKVGGKLALPIDGARREVVVLSVEDDGRLVANVKQEWGGTIRKDFHTAEFTPFEKLPLLGDMPTDSRSLYTVWVAHRLGRMDQAERFLPFVGIVRAPLERRLASHHVKTVILTRQNDQSEEGEAKGRTTAIVLWNLDFGLRVRDDDLRTRLELQNARLEQTNLILGQLPVWIQSASSSERDQWNHYRDYLREVDAGRRTLSLETTPGGQITTRENVVGDFELRLVLREIQDLVNLEVEACGEVFSVKRGGLPRSAYSTEPEYRLERNGNALIFRHGPRDNHELWRRDIRDEKIDEPTRLVVRHKNGPLRIRRLVLRGTKE